MTSADLRAVAAASDVKLPRPPGVIRRFMTTHPRLVDGAIVVCYLFGVVLMSIADAGMQSPGVVTMTETGELPANGGDTSWFQMPETLTFPLVLLTLLRVAAVATALALRRKYPLAGLIVVVLALMADGSAVAFANTVALWFMTYAVPVYRSVAAGWVGYVIAAGATTLGLVFEAMGVSFAFGGVPGEATSLGDYIATGIMGALWLLAVLMLGINLGNRRRYLGALIEHAHQLARERDQLAQLAVAEERGRIAREMHDIVAHSVSVMIALSEGAAQAAQVAPSEASDAMRRSAETGRTALAEMRRLLGALSDPSEGSAERTPQPSVEQLPVLIDSFREAGLDVTYEVTGTMSGDRGQELAVFRIAQEGLTNALRYAGTGARVHVRVEGSAECTEIEVRDYGPSSERASTIPGVGAGRGLHGLSERVRMFGGTIESGPMPGGGWRLMATLPVSAAARVTEALGPTEGNTRE